MDKDYSYFESIEQAEQIKDGILQDPESYLTQLDQGSNTLVDPSYVEYFLEIETVCL